MPPNPESMQIASLFDRYVKTGDKTLIKDITEDKLEIALHQYSLDVRSSHYSAMKMRLEDLKKERIAKEQSHSNGQAKQTVKPGWKQIENAFDITKRKFGKKISFIKEDFKREIIFRDVEQAFLLAETGLNKPAVILAGSVIEELLRLYLDSKKIKPTSNTFDCYIKACQTNNLLKSAIHRLSDAVRQFRNLVHMAAEASPRQTISKATAKGAVASIFTIANDLEF